jgi:steroid delta-isomerase-like uncharacterized protein
MTRDGDVTRKAFIGTSAATAAGAGLLGLAAADAAAEEHDRRRSLRKRRERQVLEHMDSENRQEFDDTLETFEHPRYEIIPTGDVYDGPEEVAEYYRSTRTTFPDQRNENVVMYHADADDAIIVEFDLLGTMLGALRGIPPTGRSFRVRMTAYFLFEKRGDGIVVERVYFDLFTFLQQLGLLELVVGAGLVFPAKP